MSNTTYGSFTISDINDGVGIAKTIPYYLASSKSTGVTIDEPGWSRIVPELTPENKYLWIYYSNVNGVGDTDPVLIEQSGEMVTFENDGGEAPLDNITVEFAPKQDLNGYDRPWPAGGGKNLLDVTKASFSECTLIDVNKGSVNVNFTNDYYAFAKVTAENTPKAISDAVLNGTQFTFEVDNNANHNITIVIFGTRSNGSIYQETSVTGNKVTITPSGFTSFTSIEYRFYRMGTRYTVTNQTVTGLRVSTGSDATTFEPYENICPISGFTGVKVNRTGKNLFNPSAVVAIGGKNTYTLDGDTYTMTWQNGALAMTTRDVQVFPAGQYTIGVYGTNTSNVRAYVYSAKTNAQLFIQSNFTAREPFYIGIGGNYSNPGTATFTIQLALGSTDSEYEPYQGSTYDITFPTEAGTVYSGMLDASTGELLVDRVLKEFNGSENFSQNTSWGNYTFLHNTGIIFKSSYTNQNISKSSHFAVENSGGGWGSLKEGHFMIAGNYYIGLYYKGTVEELKAWLKNQSDSNMPVQVLGALAEPVIYHLTPQQVTALVGENHIWSDAESVDISYYNNASMGDPYVIGIYGDKGQDGSNFKVFTTGYSYTQDLVNQYGTAGYSGTWTVNEATTGLKVGDTVQIQIKNSSKNGDAFIVAIVTAINNKNVTARTIGLIDKGDVGKDGDPGFGVVAVVERNNFTDAQWNEYGTVGHLETWGSTSSIRNGARIGDIFYVTGTSTDTGSSHTLTYVCDNTSGDLHGKCLGHTYAVGGKNATSYSLIVSHAAVVKAVDGTYNPTAITLTAKSQTGTAAMQNYSGRFKIETTTNGTTWTNTSSSSTKDEATKSFTIPSGIIAVRCSLYASGGTTTLLDQQTVPIVESSSSGANLLRFTEKLIPTYDETTGLVAWGSSKPLTVNNTGVRLTFDSTTQDCIGVPLSYHGAVQNSRPYVLSFDYRSNIALSSWVLYFIQESGSNVSKTITAAPIVVSETEWQHVELPFEYSDINPRITTQILLFYDASNDTTKWIEIKKKSLKLEEGSVASPWSPATIDLGGYSVSLSNDSHTFAAGVTAAIASDTTTTVIGYKGATKMPTTIGTITGLPTGMTATISNNGTKTASIKFAVTTSMTTKQGVVNIPVTMDGENFTVQFGYSLAITGDRGTTWYAGTGITGTNTAATIFSGSGVADAKVGDHYLNTSTQNVYVCKKAGAASVATWSYEQNIRGEKGNEGTNAYFHVKYSNDGGEHFTTNNGEDPGKWMGTYTDSNEADSMSVSAYKWVRVRGEMEAIESKEYTGVTITANNDAEGHLYFAEITPIDYYTPWRIKYQVRTKISSLVDSSQYSEITINGARNTYQAYQVYNSISNTSYRPIYYHLLYTARDTGLNNGYGHLLGFRLQSAYWPSAVANFPNYSREFKIDIMEAENCEVVFWDNMVTYANVPGTGTTNYYSRITFDAVTQGFTESGDRNETNHILNNFYGKTGPIGVWSTSLFMRDGNGTYQNICTASDGTVTTASGNKTVETTKKANPNGFQVESQIYYSSGSSYNANSNMASTVYASMGAFDSRYSINSTLTANFLTPYKPIYLVGEIRSDGLYYLDNVWWTQTPTDTSKVYVIIGNVYDSTTSYCRITLTEPNTWYIYDGTKLVEYGKARTDAIAAEQASFASTVNATLGNLQNQIDRQIETYYYNYEPTLSNVPANAWTTEETRAKHEGDLFYDKTNNHAYRFMKDGSTWKWMAIADTDISTALSAASKAQDTADSKRRVFTAQPTNADTYDKGDLWMEGTTGDILTCTTAKAAGAAYNKSHWSKLNKYTDDTTANGVAIRVDTLEQETVAYYLNVSNAAIVKTLSNTYDPTSILLTAKAQKIAQEMEDFSGFFKIEIRNSSGTWESKYTTTSTTGETSKTYTVPSGAQALRCSLFKEKALSTLLDQQVIPVVNDGENGNDAYTVILTNENHTFSADTEHALGGSTTCGIVAYKGDTRVGATIGSITGCPTGMTAVPVDANQGTVNASFTVTVTTAMATKNGTLTVPVTVDGKVFNRVFTYSLSLAGPAGVSVSGLAAIVNADGYSHSSNGEVYYHGYNDDNKAADINGWVQWNGKKIDIPKGCHINPDTKLPYNTTIYSVYRLSSATATTGTFSDVYWNESTKKWMAGTYTNNGTAMAAVAAWTWNEATDIILAMYKMPGNEAAIVDFQLFTPPKKYSELTEQINSKADAAGTAAANAQDAADQAQSDIDNLEIGGRNIARDSLPTNANSLWSVTNGTFATEDGYDCIKFVGALKQTGTGYPTFTMFNDTITDKRQLVLTNGAEFVFSADVKFVDVVKGTTNYFVSLYGGGATIDGTWRGPSHTTDGEHFTALTTSNLDPDKLNGKGWTRVWVKIAYSDTYEWPGVGIYLYARDFTGTVFFKNIKIEKGNRPTDWTPAPEDTTSLISSLKTQVDGKIETWTGTTDPATWAAADRDSHVGDLWYYTGQTGNGRTNNTTYKYTKSGTTYSWNEYSAAGDLFSQINGKRSIFYGLHTATYTGVVTGDLLIEPDGTNYKWDGSKWVKVAEIQIGGRNLIRRTDYSVYGSDMYRNASKATFESDRITVQYGSEVYPISYPKNKLNMMIPSGTTVICSVHVFSQTIPDGYHRIYVSPLTESGTVSWVNIKVIPTGFTGKLTWTYTTTFDCYGFVQDFDTRNSTSGQMTLGRIKVEKGNRDTDWSPAPEDVSSEITTAVDNVSVGGRNLLRELDIRNHKATTLGVTYEYEGDGWWHVYGTYNSTSNTVFQMYGLSDSAVISTGGDQYTLSIENDGVLTVGHDSSAGIRVQIRRKKLSTDGILIDYYDASQSVYLFNVYEISTVKIHCIGSTMNGKTIDGRIRMKLEKGNKPTDWSPAPEDIAHNIVVGGRNLAASSKILPTVESVLVSETITESEHLYNINISGSNQGIYITTGHLTVGENYVLSYKFKKVSGTLSSIGGHCEGFTDVRAYMDGENIGRYHSAKAISDNTDTHSIVVYLKYAGGASDNRLYIQPNRSTTSTGVFDIWDIQLEKGDKATDWTPAPEDVDASIQTAVNSIEVGGRNYLKKSDIYYQEPYTYKGLTFEYEGNGWFHVSGTAASLSEAANYTLYGTPTSEYNITNDGTYTLSIENDGLPLDDATLMQISVGYFKAEGVSITNFYVNTDPTSDHESPRTYTGYSTGRIRVWLGANLNGQVVDGRFRLKLEKGNRGTDWSPAPEDVESDLAKTKNDLNTKIDELVASEQAYRDTVTERVSTLEDFAIGEEQAQMIFNNQITTSEVIKTLQGDVLSTKTSTQTIYKYITFADGSIALSTDQAGAISLLIQNNRISFQQNGTEVAYISDRKLYITEAEILANSDKQGSLTLGNFAFIPQTNGSLSFKKVK